MHAILIFFLLLPKLLVHCSPTLGQVMKRESGEKPEQTRCCEFLFCLKKLGATVRMPDGKAS